MLKFFALFLALCFVLSFPACKGTTTEEASAVEAAVAETAPDPVNKLDNTTIVGTYMDSTSQRAVMTMEFDEATEVYTITVSWANSAMEAENWTMHCKDTGDAQFRYTDCIHSTIVYNENGEAASTTVHYENGSGYFTYDGDNARLTETKLLSHFLWDGAADENCKACVFEQVG